MLGNLVGRSSYKAADAPVRVVVVGRESDLLFRVFSHGPAIDRSTLAAIFDPLVRGPKSAGAQYDNSLGLGLYIAREITKAHGGHVESASDQTETVFEVPLPRLQHGAP